MEKSTPIMPRVERKRLPSWLKKPASDWDKVHNLKKDLRIRKLATVCEEARCPNLGECWSRGTATIMVMGDTCTRACKFCNVKTGKPLPLDAGEPLQTAEQVKALGLKHVVITSVDRDDMPDGGAAHFAEVVREVRRLNPQTRIEVLTPDFDAVREHLETFCASDPDVMSHNIETVERLTPLIRSRAKYRRSLEVLRISKELLPHRLLKSGIMLGMGETSEEVIQTLRDLYDVGVRAITIGQYLQPTQKHWEVKEFIEPAQFDVYRDKALEMGYTHAFSGPFVRSSYMAEQVFEKTV